VISIVCVYNNKGILDNYLIESLKNQTMNYELILIDNTQSQFKSAAKALNYGGRKAKGDYLIFVHQDVMLSSDSWLERAQKIVDKLPNLGIAGIAGKSESKSGVISNIKHSVPPKLAGKIQIKNSTNVQTLDECLVIIPSSKFNILQFDEKVCDDWHLYVVDYCLSIKKLGFDVYVIPIFLYHRSPGYSFSEKYYVTLTKVLKKHKKHYKLIYTTMGDWSTMFPLNIQRQRIWHLAIAGVKFLLEKSGGGQK